MATKKTHPDRGPRRQWGSDRRVEPIPMVAPFISDRRIMFGRMAIVLTVCAWFAYVVTTIVEQFVTGRASSARLVMEAIAYLLVVTALTASAMAYLITRIGFFYRSRAHRRAPRAAIDHFFTQTVPTVTVLVPSYQEDERIIRTTLLSAALQEHPHLRVVLLIDDPPNPTSAANRRLLETARALPGRIADEMAVPLGRVRAAMEDFELIQSGDRRPSTEDMTLLAAHYEFSADWLRELGAKHEIVDHSDSFFVDHVLGALARDLDQIAEALHAGAEQGATLTTDRLLQLYRRLVATFRAEMSSFERKQYVSSSHAANKAMNLNSYITLMGNSHQEIATPLGRALVPCSPRHADLTVPDPDYVLTLDADSVLLPEYCVRILYLMEQNGHAKVGVAQTPYSSYPGSATRIERISGATTDLQHIAHQGMTHYDATFWVGANAILRKRALDDIVEVDYEGNWQIRRYIQDRTVIEDTESTIDLGIHGWTLLNYPERLAYSATPPDFGSLCIQRQRWANGGLLILTKLREQSRARRARGDRNRFGEVFLRVNYMASIFWASMCLLVLLVYPFNSGLLKPLLPMIALPYFLMMATDLRYCGYRRLDVLRIYGFNLILLPVNLSGTFASILQMITGEKSSFKRTPKVRDRTTAAAGFILAPLALAAFSLYNVVQDIQLRQWSHLFFAALNFTLTVYAMVAFVGVRNCVVDLWVQLRGWLYRPVPVTSPAPVAAKAGKAPALHSTTKSGAIGDWASVLHYGSADSIRVVTATSAESNLATVNQPMNRRRDDFARGAVDADSSAMEEFTFFTVYQPIIDLITGEAVGYEALTRFADGRSPLEGLEAAGEAGIGVALDIALAEAAIASAGALPEGAWLSLNISPGLAVQTARLAQLVASSPCTVVFEMGDQFDVPSLVDGSLGRIPNVLIAIDGAGLDTLDRIRSLRPAFVKLRQSAIHGIEDDQIRQTIMRSLVAFADANGCTIISQGVETEAERDALRSAGVHLGQGYFVGRPVPIARIGQVNELAHG